TVLIWILLYKFKNAHPLIFDVKQQAQNVT
ncbi:MAG: hypothetical protein ACI9FU_002410, partial [Granulosicoccus sp.]